MIKMFRDKMRKGYNSVAKLNPEDMKPTGFKMNVADLGRMHNLRFWYLQNSPNVAKKYQYLRETEMLHDEINHMSFLQSQKRLLLFALVSLTYYYIWLEPEGDKFEFSSDYDMKQVTRSFTNLEDGGFEVVL